MKFQYGSFQHDQNEVSFSRISRTLARQPNGRANLLHVEWGMKGKIIRSSQTAILSALNDRMLAYASDGYSAAMLDNNGNLTTWFLDTSQAVGGVRVSQSVSHQVLQGAEGVTFLHYEFGLAADFLSLPGGFLSFSESLSFNDIDGGPIQVERIPAQGPPILQTVSERSWYFVTQQGQSTIQGTGASERSVVSGSSSATTGIKSDYGNACENTQRCAD